MTNNKHLSARKKNPNDELYTRFVDVVKHLEPYKEHFRGRAILCPFDNESSAFWKYFTERGDSIGIESVTCSHISAPYVATWKPGESVKRVPAGGGSLVAEGTSFFSGTVSALLSARPIVVSNPPFSLMKSIYNRLFEFNADFILLGPKTFQKTGTFFNRYAAGRAFPGVGGNLNYFTTPSGATATAPAVFTSTFNVPRKSFPIAFDLPSGAYPRYDNTNIYHVLNAEHLPIDSELCSFSCNAVGKVADSGKFVPVFPITGKIGGKCCFTRCVFKRVEK